MPRAKRQSFDHLSKEERAVVGNPEDYAWESAIDLPARPRQSDSVQFSLRLERADMNALHTIAASRGASFSETVRDAIRRYVAAGGASGLTNIQISVGSVGILRSEGRPAQLQPNRADPETAEMHMGERSDLPVGSTSSGI